LLYDPRKLATPWDQISCSGNEVIRDLHWQHTITSKSSRTAVKGGTRDSQSLRSSNNQAGVPLHASTAPDHAAVLATPAPTSHVRPRPLHNTLRQCQCDLLPLLCVSCGTPSEPGWECHCLPACLESWCSNLLSVFPNIV